MPKIFVVEDDESIRELIGYALSTGGYDYVGFEKPAELWKALETEKPHLFLLDIMLPGEDGLSVLRKIRATAEYKEIPIMMLTAKSSEYDKVKGLDSGADDYMTKPFSVLELLSRVRALLRRTTKDEQKETLTVGELSVDRERRIVTANGQTVTLTFKEFELLCLLMENAERVISRDKIMEKVWGFDFEGESRTVDMHIKTLRQKLGRQGEYIETVRGVGYKVGNYEKKD